MPDHQPCRPIRFIHAADLHLDTAFSALSRDNSSLLAKHLHQATFTALERLVQLCEREKPDFLLLAGDTYNQEDHSLRSQIALRNACEKLAAKGIGVFIVHGNHDPLGSRLQSLAWPDNVKVFGTELEIETVCDRNGALLCEVQGISYAGAKETRNLARLFKRTASPCPQIGILHTSLNTSAPDSTYAPCTPEDLRAAGLDYWALGHVHQYSVAAQNPLAVYPGALQGLHINEPGPHGCVLVTLQTQADPAGHFQASHQFISLAPLAWQSLDLDLETLLDGQNLDSNDLTALDRVIRDAATLAAKDLWPDCQTLLLRVRLGGRTVLDQSLRRYAVQTELLDLLQENLGGPDLEIRLKDLLVETRPAFEREQSILREDLLGEVLRQADHWRENEQLLISKADQAHKDLLGRVRSRQLLQADSPDQLRELLLEAERICSDFLENN